MADGFIMLDDIQDALVVAQRKRLFDIVRAADGLRFYFDGGTVLCVRAESIQLVEVVERGDR